MIACKKGIHAKDAINVLLNAGADPNNLTDADGDLHMPSLCWTLHETRPLTG